MSFSPVKTNADRKALEQGYYFDQDAAERVCRFAESYYTISRGAQSRQLVRLLDWQRYDLIYPLFGWFKPSGHRRYSRAYISMAKKNGKDTCLGFLSAYALMADGEESPTVLVAATTRKQASQIYDDIAYARNYCQKIKDATHVVPSQKRIEYPKRNGVFYALSADAPGAEGVDASFLVVNELHAHRSDKLYRSLQYSTAARKNGMLVVITTAGMDFSSQCYALYSEAKAILDGESEDLSLFPLIYEADKDCDILDERQWERANPSLGFYIDRDKFAEEAKAAAVTPRETLHFRRYKLNQWVRFSEKAWLDYQQWEACETEFPNLEKVPCHIGLDLSVSFDLSCIGQVIPHGGKYYVRVWAYANEEKVKQRESLNYEKYLEFVQDGNFTFCKDAKDMYSKIRAKVAELNKVNPVKDVTSDKYNATETLLMLENEGYKVFTFPQQTSYFNFPCKKLEEYIASGTIAHEGTGVLNWSAQNCVLYTDKQDLVKPDRDKSTAKIDPVVSILHALNHAVIDQAGPDEYIDASKNLIVYF